MPKGAADNWLETNRNSLHQTQGAPVDPGFISSDGPGFDAQNPDHMLIAVEYVEEFVAQSDKYPLDPNDQ